MGFREYLNESSDIVQVSTYGDEYIGFTKKDIQEQLKEMNMNSDSLVGWLNRTLKMGMFMPDFKRPRGKKAKAEFEREVIKNILQAILDGDIKKIEISDGFRGFKNINPADYMPE